MRRLSLIAFLALVLVSAVPAAEMPSDALASGSPTPVELEPPAAADRTTARLAVSGGDGSHRVALWTATNARRELCIGWALDSRAAPARFTCLRHGLEPPLLTVETGGGTGGVATRGVIVGLASSLVGALSADTLFGARTSTPVVLGRRADFPGWRVFSTGPLDHPTSTKLEATDVAGRPLAEVSGAAIHPTGAAAACNPCLATPPPTSGQPLTGEQWQDTVAQPRATGSAEPALAIALASPVLRPLLVSRHPWLENAGPWTCSGRTLGYALTFRLAEPATFTATLPSLSAPHGDAAYAVSWLDMRVEGTNELLVSVDTNTREVVGVMPLRWPFAPGPGPVVGMQVVSAPRDGGGPVAAPCWQSHD